jgi:GABA(A) receptor-associated protein
MFDEYIDYIPPIDWKHIKKVTSETITETARTAYGTILPPPKCSKAKFHDSYNIDVRRNMFKEINKKYPNYIPIIVEKSESSRLYDIPKRKFLVPTEMTIGSLIYRIRAQIEDLHAHEGLFIFTDDGRMPSPPSMTVKDLYKSYKSEDGFMYITYREESVFGSLFYITGGYIGHDG